MHSIESILNRYHFTGHDQEILREMAEVFNPVKESFADEFYRFLVEDSNMASYFGTDSAIAKRKETILWWLNEVLTARYDSRFLLRMVRIGKTHVKIGLDGHYVNAAMGFVRRYLQDYLNRAITEPVKRENMIETLDKALDISLDIMTSSYREAELEKVFISQRVELWLVRWAEKLMHGLNLVLMMGLVAMSLGVTLLLSTDIFYALTESLERGVIKALGSLLILWMMIELLHTQVQQLKGGKFHVRIFVDLAMVAFIRKVFVATINDKDSLSFALLLGGLLVLGVIYFLIGRSEKD